MSGQAQIVTSASSEQKTIEKTKTAESDLRSISVASEAYYVDWNKYTATLAI